ncbi:filamentous hemagglutinin N-terminal domain-containing protein [Trichocoleus sp. FACHB-262]|uniref:two-partner secretion domain-containing protein n=1 Tax=Trichocoleus sp. FACHB-262 TaxID=2692869 RepID=UPI00168458E4|nr:filamentous hemagglutinin N-terminal domain-containing protein [Trichocoleus sp. FACHB-262]MBD2120539.1 filamentous hemagglutinin N-terminal domain-containing protein [Trichocoleus sp. FACHB-262]
MQRRNPFINSGWLWLTTSVIISSLSPNAQAQVVPDATLGNGNNSVTSTVGDRTDITGGLQRNSSLFHSFEQFNVNTNKQVYFANPTDIRNIFSRVTGGNLSNIDGTLGVAGSANLFFINPNGIIFGPNARLDIAGSFFASTADALTFTDGQKFAATGDRAAPLVEVNIPLGLQMGPNSPAILTNQGQLAVGASQNLTLAGGITTSTGSLTASGGTVQVLGNQVNLQDQAQIDVSSPTGGGTVLVGGDYQGKGSLLNATQTSVGTGVTINANATNQGKGGKVIVWSDDATQFNGTINARGGKQGGDGGFVEVSGRQNLAFQGQVDAGAFQGQPGQLLLDPGKLTIKNGGTNNSPIPPTGSGDFTIDPIALRNALNNSPIVLQADTSITFDNALDASVNEKANNLALNTPWTVLNAPITLKTGASLTGTATKVDVNAGGLIQNGIDAAAVSGATVNVGAGSYTGSVNVNKPLDLVFKGIGVNLTGNLQTTPGIAVGLSGALKTTQAQAYNDVTLNGNTALTGTNLTFTKFNGNNHDLQLDFANQISVSNTLFSNIEKFVNNGSGGTLINGNFTTSGAQEYKNAVKFGADTQLTSNGSIQFGGTVDATDKNTDVTIAAGTGDVTFGGAVGTDRNGALGTLDITSEAVQLNTTNANNLNINATGAITQTGDLTVGGTTTLAAGANDITLDRAGNNFNTVQVTSDKNVTLNDTNALKFGTSDITGNLNVTTKGAITQTGDLTIGGTTSLASGNTNNITLMGANNFNTVQINSGNDVSLNDVNVVNLGTSTVSGDLNVTGATINIPSGASVKSTGGNIKLNGTTSITNAGSLIAPGKTISIFGGQIALDGGSLVNVSGSKGGTVQIDGSQVGIAANARINADANSTTGPGGTIKVTVLDPLRSPIHETTTNITAKGSPEGEITLPPSVESAISAAFPTTPDPNTSAINDITIVDGNGQSIITALQGSIDPFFQPFLQNDPILYQYYAGTLFQNLRIPQTALEGTTPSIISSLLTQQDIILAARNNITIQDLTNQGTTPNQLTLTSPGTTGSIQLAAGGVFTMNHSDTIQTSGRSIRITALNTSGVDDSLTIGGINASSPTAVGGDIILTAANGNIKIGNGINPTLLSSNSIGNTVIQPSSNRLFSRIQVEATTGSVDVNNVQVQANSDTGYAGKVSINAANTIAAKNQTIISANGQSGDITIGSILSPSVPPVLRPENILVSDTQLSSESNFKSLPGGGLLTAGAIRLGANTIIQVIDSKLSSSASANATAGAVEIQTTNNSSGLISLNNSVLKSEASGSSKAGVINLIDASTIALNGTTISNTVVNGNGGKTTINGGTIAISGGTTIQADTSGQGSAGNIEITATAPNPDSNAAALTIDNSQVTATTNPDRESDKRGNAGQVSLKATNGDIAIKNSSTVSSSTFSDAGPDFANGGVVRVTGQNFSLLNGSVIQARSTGTGRPGSISIDVPNTITISGTSPSGQVSEVSTFSGASADLSSSSSNPSDLLPGDIRINQSESPVNNLILSERGRINASTQSTKANFTGGNIQVYADNLNITSGGQIVASSLDDGNPDTLQAGAGNINVVSDNINISGSQQSFNTDPNFRSTIFAKPIGNVTSNGTLTLLSTRGGERISTLAPALGLASGDPLLSNTFNGSGVQLFALGDGSGSLAFDWTFLTNESTGIPDYQFNDSSFLTTTQGNIASLTDVNTGSFKDSSVSGFDRETIGSPTQTLTVSPGSSVNIGVFNVGDAAVDSGLRLSNLTLNSALVRVIVSSPDINPKKTFTSGIFAKADGTGNAGKIAVNTPRLTLEQGAEIAASTEKGIAGDIVINGGGTGQVTLSNGAQISGSTVGGKGGTIDLTGLNTLQTTNSLIAASTTKNGGSAGAVTVNAAQSVTLDGTLPPGITGSIGGISTQASDGNGSAGAITVNTSQLKVQNGAAIAASTETGVAGNILIDGGGTGQVTLSNGGQISGSTVGGQGGKIELSGLNTLQATNSLIAASTTKNGGSAGAVTVNAAQSVTLDGTLPPGSNLPPGITGSIGGISTQASKGDGSAGAITVNTSQLKVQNGAAIAASTETGAAGNILINGGGTGQVTLNSGAQISGSTEGGKGGTIDLSGLNTLQATNSLIAASTTGDGGSAGAVTVNAAQSVTLDGTLPPGITGSIGGISTQASKGDGSAGAITVNTAQLNIQNGAAIAASTDSGKGDNIILNGLNTLQLDNGIISASTQTGTAGDVTVTANQGSDPSIQLLNNSTIEATAKKQKGQAGGVTITTPSLTVTGSKIATSNEGPQDQIGGTSKDIQLQGLNSLTVNGGSQITASTQTGQAGAVLVNAGSPAAQSVQITGVGTQLAAQAEDLKGNARNVILNAKQVKVTDKAIISASNVSDSGISGQTGGVSFENLEALEVSGGGTIEAKTQDGQAGNVNVAASQSVLLDQGTLSVKAGGRGKAGILTVTAPTLTLQNSGEILATTNSGGSIGTGSIILKDLNTLTVDNSKVSASTQTGTAGSVTITANQGSDPSIQLVNKGTVEAIAEKGGSAGNVTLTTPTLNITTGASVAVSSKDGEGTAGDIEVNANKTTLDNGTITATTDKGGQASSADIILKNFNSLTATNNSQISASTNSGTAGNVKISADQGNNPAIALNNSTIEAAAKSGKAGEVAITTSNLAVNNSLISSSTTTGTAGGVTVKVNGSVTLNGTSQIKDKDSKPLGGIVAAATEGGSAGNVDVTSGKLAIQNGARISVSSPAGQAGNLNVTTNDLRMDQGTLEAVTGGVKDGANIDLKVGPGGLLLMRNGSLISANANNTANGGNIKIKAPFVIGLTFENSDIVANAVKGQGGKIDIETQAILGLNYRPKLTPRSDITASSEFGVSGSVNLNTLSTDATRGLSTPAIAFIDVSRLTANACAAGGAKAAANSELRINGRGGVPLNPTAPLPAQTTESDWVSLNVTPEVPTTVTFSGGNNFTLESGETYQLQATCVRSWKEQQRPTL